MMVIALGASLAFDTSLLQLLAQFANAVVSQR